MPYIAQNRREALPFQFFNELPDEPTPGDLNYLYTIIAHEYLAINGVRYARINDIIGALECCKAELYRRIAGEYEDEAIARNGDVIGV